MIKREIKYRAWDGSCMYSQDDCYFTFGKDEKGQAGKYWSCYLYEKNGSHYCCDSTDEDVVMMQYTGIKDCKGKDIYEGDVIRNPNSTEPEDVGFEVCFDGFGFKYKSVFLIEGKKMIGDPFSHTSSDYEVVGNVYENPELLKND